jgi:hypothetical protein
MKTRSGFWRAQDMTRNGKCTGGVSRQAFRRIYRSSFCAQNANLLDQLAPAWMYAAVTKRERLYRR